MQVAEPLNHHPNLMRISFHIQLKFSPKMILIDSVSDEEGQEGHSGQMVPIWEPCIWGYLHGPRDFLLLLRVPYRLPCRQLIVYEPVLCFTLCLRDQTLTILACNRDFMKKFH
jgi:hypothetical protein